MYIRLGIGWFMIPYFLTEFYESCNKKFVGFPGVFLLLNRSIPWCIFSSYLIIDLAFILEVFSISLIYNSFPGLTADYCCSVYLIFLGMANLRHLWCCCWVFGRNGSVLGPYSYSQEKGSCKSRLACGWWVLPCFFLSFFSLVIDMLMQIPG